MKFAFGIREGPPFLLSEFIRNLKKLFTGLVYGSRTTRVDTRNVNGTQGAFHVICKRRRTWHCSVKFLLRKSCVVNFFAIRFPILKQLENLPHFELFLSQIEINVQEKCSFIFDRFLPVAFTFMPLSSSYSRIMRSHESYGDFVFVQ